MKLNEETVVRKETETQLIIAAQRGDRQAFGTLAMRYQRAIYTAALRKLGSDADAQELVQEVLIQVLRRLHQLRDPERFAGWLRVIVNRMAINRAVRRKPVLSAASDAIQVNFVERNTPLDSALANERRQQVRNGLKRLRELDRRTLVAFYVQGHSLVEMSDEFDSPIGTIKRRLHVARKRLAKELGGLVAT